MNVKSFNVVRPLAGQATFERRRLVLSNTGLEYVKKPTFSPSTAAAISSCGARYVVERLLERLAPREVDPLGAAELGTATHTVFEDLFALPKGQRGLGAGVKILESLERSHPELEAPKDPAEKTKWLSEVQKRVVGLWEIEDPNEIEVLARELHVAVDLDGIPFNGFVDRIRKADDGCIITDYKGGAGAMKRESARFGDPHGDQIRLYSRAVAAKYPELGQVVGGEVLYVFHRKRRDVDCSPEAMDGTRMRYEKAWESLTKQTEAMAFGMKTSSLCGWCPAVLVCPAAIAANKEPRTSSAEIGPLLGIEVRATTTATEHGAADITEDNYDPSVDFGDSADASTPCLDVSPGTEVADQPIPVASEPTGSETMPPSSNPVPQSTIRSSLMYDELKPWDETNPDGSLNLNSYASTAAFGTVELAVETMYAAGEKILPKTVDAFSETLALIVQHCQELLDVQPSMQNGSHTRLRGALRTSIVTLPPPFGGNVDAWATWAKKTEKRVLSIHAAALRLWSVGGQAADPWTELAVADLEVA